MREVVRDISLIIMLIMGIACYCAAAVLAGRGKWQDALLFAALGAILYQ